MSDIEEIDRSSGFNVPIRQGWEELGNDLNASRTVPLANHSQSMRLALPDDQIEKLKPDWRRSLPPEVLARRSKMSSIDSSRRKSSLFYNPVHSLLQDDERFTETYYDPNALWIFPLKNRFRRFCIKISENKYFEYFIIVLILSNCAFLACDRPEPQRDCFRFDVTKREKIYLVFYVLEMIIKIIAFGFLLGQNAYLSDSWNKLDFFIVITGLISWASGADSFGIFRVFRILRPLRLLTNMQGMRMLVVGFFESIPLLLNTLALLFFLFLMWGLFGLNMFGEGRFRKFCQNKYLANVFRYDDPEGCNDRFDYLKHRFNDDRQVDYDAAGQQVYFGSCAQAVNGAYFTVIRDNDTAKFHNYYVTYSEHDSALCDANSTIWSQRCELNFCCPVSGEIQNLYIGGEYGSSEARDWHFTMKLPVCDDQVNEPEVCTDDEECVNTMHSAYLGFISFDNLPIAILTIFQVLTLEDWWTVLEATLPSSPYNSFRKWWEVIFIYSFFISLVIFGSFFVLNLTIVAIKAKLVPKEPKGRKSFSGGMIRKSVYNRERSNSFSRSVNKLIQQDWFNRFFMILIILNTVVLGAYHHRMSKRLEDVLDWTNTVLTVLFVLEMVVKMIGLGIMGYCEETFNIFDGVIAILSFVEMIILAAMGQADGLGLSAFRLLRLFRLFRVARVVKLVRYFETLQRIIWVISCSLESIMNIAMLLSLFIFSFALMGMTLFGQQLEEPYGPYPFNPLNVDRSTFENFLAALVSVFQVLTLEGWVDVMRNTVRQTSWWSCIFFIAWIVIGVYCLLNMFLAIVLQNFEQDQKRQLEKRLEEKRVQQGNNDLSPRLLKGNNLSIVLGSQSTTEMEIELEGRYSWRLFCACRKRLSLTRENQSEIQKDVPLEDVKAEDSDVKEGLDLELEMPSIEEGRVKGKVKLKPLRGIKKLQKVVKGDAFRCMQNFDKLEKEKSICAVASIIVDQQENLKHTFDEEPAITFPEDHILVDHEYYEPLANFVFGKVFQTFIAFLIALSTIALAMDDNRASPKLKSVLEVLDIIFFVFFLGEAILKITVMGFMGRPDAYLSDSWNVLDFFVILTSPFSIINSSGSLFSAFRALRAFRPLRLLSRYEGMRVVTKALFRSLPAMINVVAVTLLVWLIFAICGVELLSGQMNDCYDAQNLKLPAFTESDYSAYAAANNLTVASGEYFSACKACDEAGDKFCAINHASLPTDERVCAWMSTTRDGGANWKRARYNFDDVPQAMLTLFVVSTLEGWVDIMWLAVDSRSVFDCRPVTDTNRLMALYFMIFIVIGSFFFVSLFVGVVFDNFVKLRDEEMGLGLLTDVQKNWVNTQKMVLKAKPVIVPQPPTGKRIVPGEASSSMRDKSVRAEENWRMPFYRLVLDPSFEKLIMICIILNVMVMCFHSYPIKVWKKSALDGIDLFFTIVFTIEMVIKLIGLGPWQYVSDNWNKFDAIIIVGAWASFALKNQFSGNLSMLPMLRILRLFRVSRLIRLVKSMQRLKMLLRTLIISLPSLANVGTLLMLMYSVSAIFFMNILNDVQPDGICITEFVNFNTFGRAISTLFWMSTGDNWQCTMDEACSTFEVPGLCFISFVMFYVIVAFVTLNLFIAIIIDNFAIVAVEDEKEDFEEVKLTAEMVANFSDAWAILDPGATKFIPHTEFTTLLQLVEPPLGLGKDGSRLELLMLMNKAHVPVHDNSRIHYGEVLFALADYHCGATLPSNTKIYRNLTRQLTQKLPKYGQKQNFMTLSTMTAVIKCQRMWRAKVVKWRLARVKLRFTCKTQRREYVKKELEAIFQEKQAREKEAWGHSHEMNEISPLNLTKPESTKPPKAPLSRNGWFDDSEQTCNIVKKGEASPERIERTWEGEVDGEILELQQLSNNIQQLNSNQQQPSQIIINAPIHIHHYAQPDPLPSGTYNVRNLLKRTELKKKPTNKIPPLDFDL